MFQNLYEPITLQNWHIGLIVTLLIVVIGVTAASFHMTKKIEASVVKRSNFTSAGAVAGQVGKNIGIDIGQGLIEEATGVSGNSQDAIVAIASNPSGLKQVGTTLVQMGDQFAQTADSDWQSVKSGWDDFVDWW